MQAVSRIDIRSWIPFLKYAVLKTRLFLTSRSIQGNVQKLEPEPARVWHINCLKFVCIWKIKVY